MGLADKLKSLSPSLYRLRLFAFICAGIVVAMATYYFLFVRSQTGYFNNRNFRKLSLISNQIGSKLTNAGSVLEKTCERFVRLSDEELGRFTLGSDDLMGQQDNTAKLREVFNELKDDSLQIIPYNLQVEKWRADVTPGIVTLTDIRNENDSTWLYFEYVAHGLVEGTLIRTQAKTQLSALVQPFLSARVGSQQDQFQNILIAEAETARVILQYDTSQVRLASVDKLNAANTAGKTINLRDISQTSNMAEVSLAGDNYRVFSHPLKLSFAVPSTNAPSTTWIVAGLIKSDSFQSEAWSLSIPYTMLIIVGFVVAVIVFSWPFLKLVLVGPKDRFRTHDVYLLVFATMFVLAVVTAFGLYVFIYRSVERQMDGQVKTLARDLKINFQAELKDALQQLNTFSDNEALLNQLIKDAQQREQDRLRREQEKVRRELQKPPPGRVAQAVAQGGGIGIVSSAVDRQALLAKQAECTPDIYNVAQRNKIRILPCILGKQATTYPYFEMVAWIDSAGMQRAKWTVKDFTTQYVPVGDRAYFQNIQRKQFYEFGTHKFWLEPIVSRTTGRNQVEISKQVKDTDWTIAFDTRLLSLMDPVLPDAYGFVITNDDGKVLFHSDEVHHLGENLLQECDDNRKLRSALIGRSDAELEVRYSGQDYHFFVTTLEGFPDWSIIAFRNKQPLRSAFLELMTSLTALFLIHMLILMGGFTVFFFIYTRDRRKAWLWPEREKMDRYKQLSYVMLGLSFASLFLTLLLHGKWLVWISAGLAWSGALVFFLSLRYGPWSRARFDEVGREIRAMVGPFLGMRPRPKPIREDLGNPTDQARGCTEGNGQTVRFESDKRLLRRYDGVYALNLMLLVLLITIVPMGAFFKYQYESQARLFIQHAQFSMATALERRDERIRSQYAHVSPSIESNLADKSHSRETNILMRRLNESWDVYDGFFYDTVHEKHDGAQTANQPSKWDLLSSLSALIPASNQAAIERRSLLASSAVTGVCSWDSITDGGLILNLNEAAGKPSWPFRRLTTAVPILRLSVLPVIGLMFLAVLLFYLMYFMIRKVFLLDVHKPRGHSLKKFLCDQFERNAFVVANAPFFTKQTFASNALRLKRFGDSDLAGSSRWKGEFNHTECTEGVVIAFDEFEYQIDDARTNRNRLKLLKELVTQKKKILLFSKREPSEYKFGSATNGFDDGAGEWAQVMIRSFVTEFAEDTDDRYDRKDPSSFKQQVEDERERLRKEGCLIGRKQEDVDELIDILYCECARRVPLQDVALGMLDAKDFAELTKEHLVNRLVSQARSYYNYLWQSCTEGQKQTLCHLAQDGRLSHRDPDIQALLRRELILKSEGLHLFNESFRKFLGSNERLLDIAAEEQKAREESLWQTLKVPILATMIFIAGFLFWTQQDVFSSSLAVVTGVTGLLSAVFKLMSMFHGDERAAK